MLSTNANRLVGGVFLALALVGAQSARADEKKMGLVRTPKSGTVTKYKTTLKANVQGMDYVITQTQKQTIKSVKDDGTSTIVSEDLGGTLSVNGAEQEMKAGQPTTETRDKLGKLVELAHELEPNAPLSPEIQKLMASVSEILLTDKEVAAGDAWETEVENPASKENKVKVKTTYQGIEKVGGIDLWKFKQTAEAIVNTDGSKMVFEGVIWLNPKDGLLEKTDAKMKGLPTQAGPLDVALQIERVKPATGDAKAEK